MRRRIVTALLILLSDAGTPASRSRAEESASPPTREVPSAICREFRPPNRCFDLRDSEARRYFRELRGAERVWRCTSGLVSSRTTVAYTPDVIAENRVATHELTCTADHRHVRCGLEAGEAYFADDPNKYFEVGGDVATADAIELVRAYYAGRVDGEIEARDGRVTSVSLRADGSLALGVDDCGCWLVQEVRRETRGGETWLIPVGQPEGVCE